MDYENKIKKDNGLSILETFIGPSTTFKGSITTKSSVRIDGNLEGDILEADAVIIGEKAHVNGNINARVVVVDGYIKGNIKAFHNIEILPSAEIHGNMNGAILSIAEGAVIEGTCVTTPDKTKIIKLEVENDR